MSHVAARLWGLEILSEGEMGEREIFLKCKVILQTFPRCVSTCSCYVIWNNLLLERFEGFKPSVVQC